VKFGVLWIPIANLYFSMIFIHVSQPLYICKHNLQAAIDKEDCGSIAVTYSFDAVGIGFVNVPE
jgi:hypothetical protein